MGSKKTAFYLFLLGLGAALFLIATPPGSRLQYGALGLSLPLMAGAILFRPYRAMILLVLFSGIWSPQISLGFANLYAHQWVILLATLGLVISGVFVSRITHGDNRSRHGFPVIAAPPLIAFLASFSLAPDKVGAFKVFLYVGVLFCSYYIAANSLVSWRRVEQLLKAICIGSFLVALTASAKLLMGETPSTPVLSNTNALGGYIYIGLGIWIAMLNFGRHVTRSILFETIGVGLLLVTLIASLSRSAWLGFAGTVLMSLLIGRRFRVAFVISFFMAIAIVMSSQIEQSAALKIGEEGKSGVDYRIRKIEIAWDMFKESPLVGNGPGSFSYMAETSDDPMLQRHSSLECTYPYILCEFGLIGFLAFLIVVYRCYLFWVSLPRERQHPKRIIGNIIACVLFGVLLVQVGENTLFFPKTNWLIGILLGILISLRHLPDSIEEEELAESAAATLAPQHWNIYE